MIKEILFEKIVPDETIQIRAEVNIDRVNDFVDIYDKLPPIKVVSSGDRYYLADGFHRYLAGKTKNVLNMQCEVKDGDLKDALQIAVHENCRGALNLTKEDRKIAIRKMLMFFPERGNSWIADDVGTSMQSVEIVRKDMEENSEIPHYEQLDTRDGRKYPRKVQQLPSVDIEPDIMDALYATKPTQRGQTQRDDVLDSLYETSFKSPISTPVSPSSSSRKPSLSFVDVDASSAIATILSIDGDRSLMIKAHSDCYMLTVYKLMGEKFYPQMGLVVSEEELKKLSTVVCND